MQTALFFVVVLFTNAIQAITGFAGTLLAMPPSALLIGVQNARVVLNFLAFLTCLIIVLCNKSMVQWNILGRIYAVMVPSMAVGVWLFSIVQTQLLLYLYGGLIVIIAVRHLRQTPQMPVVGIRALVLLITAGLIHGMFVSGGALLVVYAAAQIKDKHAFRATVAAVWVGLNSMMLVQQLWAGQIDLQLSGLTLAACIPALIGLVLGNRLHERISQTVFLRLTYMLLLISGILCFS